ATFPAAPTAPAPPTAPAAGQRAARRRRRPVAVLHHGRAAAPVASRSPPGPERPRQPARPFPPAPPTPPPSRPAPRHAGRWGWRRRGRVVVVAAVTGETDLLRATSNRVARAPTSSRIVCATDRKYSFVIAGTAASGRQRRLPTGRRHERRLECRHQPRALAAGRNGTLDLLRRLDGGHARERRSDRRARALPGDGRAQEPTARDRRHMQRVSPARRREPGLAQQMRDLRARIRPAMAEWRRIEARPYPAPVRHHDQQPPARAQAPPDLAQQGDRIARHFERMHEEHAIDRGIGERQLELIDEGGETGPVGRPFHHPLHRRHEGEAAFRLLAKEPEIRRRIAHPEYAHAARVGKALAYAAPHEAPATTP